MEVSTVQSALGSSRSGTFGSKASRSAFIAATSCAGSKQPPFSLIDSKPNSFTIACACATTPAGSRHAFCRAAAQPVAFGSVPNASAPPAPSYL